MEGGETRRRQRRGLTKAAAAAPAAEPTAAATAAAATTTAAATATAARKVELTLEEELQKERMRKRIPGIVKFAWDDEGRKLLVSNSLCWSDAVTADGVAAATGAASAAVVAAAPAAGAVAAAVAAAAPAAFVAAAVAAAAPAAFQQQQQQQQHQQQQQQQQQLLLQRQQQQQGIWSAEAPGALLPLFQSLVSPPQPPPPPPPHQQQQQQEQQQQQQDEKVGEDRSSSGKSGSLSVDVLALRNLLLQPPPLAAAAAEASPSSSTSQHQQQQQQQQQQGSSAQQGAAAHEKTADTPKELLIHPSGRFAGAPAAACVLERQSNESPILDCTYSPCGRFIAFVQKGDIHLLLTDPPAAAPAAPASKRKSPLKKTSSSSNSSSSNSSSRKIRCKVTDSPPDFVSGLAEYVAQEEMNRMEGYWWSPHGDFIAFVEFSEAHVPPVKLQRVLNLPLQRENQQQEQQQQQQLLQQQLKQAGAALEREQQLCCSGGDAVELVRQQRQLQLLQKEEEQQQEEQQQQKRKRIEADQQQQQQQPGLPKEDTNRGSNSSVNSSSMSSSSSSRELLANEEHRFPFAGHKNVKARVAILNQQQQQPVQQLLQQLQQQEHVGVPDPDSMVAAAAAAANAAAAHKEAAAASGAADGVISLPCCTKCWSSCCCSDKSSTAAPSPKPRGKPKASSSSSSNSSTVCSGVRYIDLPVSDWGDDFYVARANWICLHSWQQLETLKLVTKEESLRMQKQQQQQTDSPPPVLVLQLQDRLQQELRICAALPVPVPPAKGSTAKGGSSKQQQHEKQQQQQQQMLRCVCCFKEKRETWISLHKDFQQVEESLFYTWSSDRMQYNDLYLQHLGFPNLSLRLLPERCGLRVVSLLAAPQNYASFFAASRQAAAAAEAAAAGKDAGKTAAAAAADAAAAAAEDEEDLYFFLQVIPQMPEDVLNSSSDIDTSSHSSSDGTNSNSSNSNSSSNSSSSKSSRLNSSSVADGDLAPLSSHAICVRLKRETLRELEGKFLTGRSKEGEVLKVLFVLVLINAACLSLPFLLGLMCSSRIRYLPDIRRLFAAENSGRCLYTAAQQLGAGETPEKGEKEASGDTKSSELFYSLEDALTHTRLAMREQQQQHLQQQQEQQQEQHLDESEQQQRQSAVSLAFTHPKHKDALTRNFYVFPHAAGCGEVVFESQFQQPLYVDMLSSLRKPEFFSFVQKEKQRLLSCYYPPDSLAHGPGPYRGVVSCYGGPLVQFVTNSWDLLVDPRAQALTGLGLLVIKTDNRGSSGRTTSFEKSISLLLGPREAADQAAACMHLSEKGLLRLDRPSSSNSSNNSSSNSSSSSNELIESGVGIFGTSYGGFLSATAYFTESDIFTCAFSVAPVIFWEGYSTHYTERYLSLPTLNPLGYRLSSVLAHIANKQQQTSTENSSSSSSSSRKLVVLHGAVDENVLLQHSLVFADALIKQQVKTHFPR
ncbi:hypothetical protein Emed_006769 [Eimeria media]